MSGPIRFIAERGKKKRVVACAFDYYGVSGRAAEPEQVQNALGPSAGTWWTVQFVIRRCAWHMLDHAWEMEDRDVPSTTVRP